MPRGDALVAVRKVVLRDPRLRRVASFAYRTVNRSLLSQRAEVDRAFVEGRWQDVVDLVAGLDRDPRLRFSPRIYLRLSVSHAHLGDQATARAVLEQAGRRMPWSDAIARLLAEWAMHERDYPRALVNWQRFAMSNDKRRRGVTVRRAPAFPVRGNDLDWYEVSWSHIVSDWDRWWAQAGQSPKPETYARLLSTLVNADMTAELGELSRLALRDHPNDREMALCVVDALARIGDLGTVGELRERFTEAGATRTGRDVASEMESATDVVADLGHEVPDADHVRILDVAHLSGADFVIRSADYWDERRIAEEALRLADRDRWPEGFADTDLLSEQAWETALEFARTRAEGLGISDETLARAVFHFVKNELCLKLPADRIAEEIVATGDGGPVFVELPSMKISYLSSYASSRFQQVYLYAALRRLGCNVFLVRFPTQRRPRRRSRLTGDLTATLVFTPQAGGLRPQFRTLEEAPRTARVLVPAGLRSVSGVLEMIAPAIVVNSGSVIKGLAYDRSVRQGFDFPVHAELHPHADVLPDFAIDLHPRRWWVRSSGTLTAIDVQPDDSLLKATAMAEVRLLHARLPQGDWFDLLARALLPYFREYLGKADDFLSEHGVDEIHIGDYVYAEPTLLASRVKRRGGTVHVWPHSTNPVHVRFHDPTMIDSVRAVTRSGAARWRERLPDATVGQAPHLMLRRPDSIVPWQPGEPLSVVVIGGRPKLRNLPILDIAAHEQTYRDLFTAMAPLVDEGLIRVYFKPRGLTGEHEQWLDTVVGRTAGWSRVLAHPNRIALDNPLFMSVSVSSSALLEGVVRGIPGVVVRGGYSRDYLTADDGSVEELSLSTVAERLAQLSSEGAWATLREAQLAALEKELR
ncbi:hypothetical protein GA707_17130 [Nostocoides sp. F2B08]|uniref:hypothetical protein n=1 Tax=Nostocoides sp. F2B08 TaxID=2653936 RepID=UPI0012632032|nr:hypothetical protein [Tetrasphaera sp. F2B08]KAB7741924.1 hypothetical protein GA707_17130 [Tetrasphaera sp. F2B08]